MSDVLITSSLQTCRAVATRIQHNLPDQYFGTKGNTHRTIVRNVPDGVKPQQVSRQVDQQACIPPFNAEPQSVYEYNDLPEWDGQTFMGL